MTRRIIVVDDDCAVRGMNAKLLSQQGYDVIERESAEDLVPLVVAAEPVAVILLMMPDIDGLAAAQQLREDWRTQGVRIIMVSACISFEAARRASELGIERYLVKPVAMPVVLAASEGRTPRAS